MLDTEGNFQSDSNADGLGDGWIKNASASNLSISNNIQAFTPTSQFGGIRHTFTRALGDVIYACAYIRTTRNIVLQFADNSTFPTSTVQGDGTWKFISVKDAANSDGTDTMYIQDSGASGFAQFEVKEVYIFNLTAIFGAPGTEPTQSQMDEMVKRALAEGYFVEKNVIRPTDAIASVTSDQPKYLNGIKFDGINDAFTIPNYPEIDFTSPPMSFVTVFTPGVGTNGYIIAKNLDSVANMQYGIFTDMTANSCTIYIQNAPFWITGVATGVKTVIIFVVIGDKLYIYKDGALKGTFSGLQTTYTSRPNVFIGKRATNNIFYNNIIDEVMIFNRALSEREVIKITNYFK